MTSFIDQLALNTDVIEQTTAQISELLSDFEIDEVTKDSLLHYYTKITLYPRGQRHDVNSKEFDLFLQNISTLFAATAAEYDLNAEFPHRNFDILHAFDLLAFTVPIEHFGYAAELPELLKVIRAIARGEPSTALVYLMQCLYHVSLRGEPSTVKAWPKHIHQLVVESAVKDGALINSLRVEPELGTPTRGGIPKTTATPSDQGWLINGRKIYSTGAPRLTWLPVLAVTTETPARIGVFLVHKDTVGIRHEKTWNHLGMRASGSDDVIFEDVWIAQDFAVELSVVGETPLKDPTHPSWGRILQPAIYDSVARAARDWLVNWLEHRVPGNLGTPLSSLQRVQEAIGQIDAWLFNNDVLLKDAADGRIDLGQGALIKYLVTTNAISVVQKALELTGNPGLDRKNPLERHYRDVLCSRIHVPQNDSILTSTGKKAFVELRKNTEQLKKETLHE